jgi:hypothetical protein
MEDFMTERTVLAKGAYKIIEVYDSDTGIYTQHLYKNGKEINQNVQGWSMNEAEALRHIAEYESLSM